MSYVSFDFIICKSTELIVFVVKCRPKSACLVDMFADRVLLVGGKGAIFSMFLKRTVKVVSFEQEKCLWSAGRVSKRPHLVLTGVLKI